jgi:aminoglycoside phosphotransferase (APT) family kinase protein
MRVGGTHTEDVARDDELWRRASELIGSSCGWSLEPVRLLGRPRDVRRTWLAAGGPGAVIVKLTANPSVAERTAWAQEALALLAARGYPVPRVLWHGRLDPQWSLVVLERLPGRPLRTLTASTLEALLALVELQAGAAVAPGGWDTADWIERVLFEDWAGWCTGAEAAAPETSRRLRAFVEPARGYRLPSGDLVHGDLNLTNVLAAGGAITGVVDWDALGHGSRASDLAGPFFDWHRLRLSGGRVAPGGDARLVGRIVELAGDDGLRCALAYGAVARLALCAERGERGDVDMWRRVIEEILDSLDSA